MSAGRGLGWVLGPGRPGSLPGWQGPRGPCSPWMARHLLHPCSVPSLSTSHSPRPFLTLTSGHTPHACPQSRLPPAGRPCGLTGSVISLTSPGFFACSFSKLWVPDPHWLLTRVFVFSFSALPQAQSPVHLLSPGNAFAFSSLHFACLPGLSDSAQLLGAPLFSQPCLCKRCFPI